MEPSELYNRNKRNLFIFAALLALVMLGGIKPEDQGQFLGFTLAAPELVPISICFVTIYCIYQYIFAWSLQSDELRSRIKYDFYVTAGAALAVVAAYVAFDIAPLLIERGFQALLLTALAIVAAFFSYILYRSTELKIWKREALSFRKGAIKERLEQPGWVLNFNTNHPQGTKPIEFLDNGAIGDGQNDNEHTWHLDDQTLTIVRRDGSLQNRFRYDANIDRFISTDDPEADAVKRGYKGQYIYRP